MRPGWRYADRVGRRFLRRLRQPRRRESPPESFVRPLEPPQAGSNLFKCFARAMKYACSKDARLKDQLPIDEGPGSDGPGIAERQPHPYRWGSDGTLAQIPKPTPPNPSPTRKGGVCSIFLRALRELHVFRHEVRRPQRCAPESQTHLHKGPPMMPPPINAPTLRRCKQAGQTHSLTLGAPIGACLFSSLFPTPAESANL